jgi:hypothetical protein
LFGAAWLIALQRFERHHVALHPNMVAMRERQSKPSESLLAEGLARIAVASVPFPTRPQRISTLGAPLVPEGPTPITVARIAFIA